MMTSRIEKIERRALFDQGARRYVPQLPVTNSQIAQRVVEIENERVLELIGIATDGTIEEVRRALRSITGVPVGVLIFG